MSTGERWTLRHRPALDGVRGVAILLVLVGHSQVDRLGSYGGVGVDVFFALSGFLITSILVEQLGKRGQLDFAEFYRRRVRRLVPALVVFVAAMSLVNPAVGFSPAREVPSNAAAMLLYAGNWYQITGHNLALMGHGWSLAVEEQFYLLWPLTLAVLWTWGRRPAMVALLAGVVGVAVWRHVLASMGAVPLLNLGSVSRSAPILLGCALALFVSSRPEVKSRPLVALVCLVGLLASPWLPWGTALFPLINGVFAVGLIASTAHGEGVGWLRGARLRLVGRRSYGLYLWHFPVMVPVLSQLDGVAWFAAWVVAVPTAWGLTLLSWRFVEEPFLRPKTRVRVSADRRPAPVGGLHAATLEDASAA